jgi:hypothetical protein
MRAQAQGELGEVKVLLADCERIIAIGSDRRMPAHRSGHGPLAGNNVVPPADATQVQTKSLPTGPLPETSVAFHVIGCGDHSLHPTPVAVFNSRAVG